MADVRRRVEPISRVSRVGIACLARRPVRTAFEQAARMLDLSVATTCDDAAPHWTQVLKSIDHIGVPATPKSRRGDSGADANTGFRP